MSGDWPNPYAYNARQRGLRLAPSFYLLVNAIALAFTCKQKIDPCFQELEQRKASPP